MFERQRALPRAPLQDAIPRVGKFGTLFRRPGQRVIVDYHGDIVVRPSPHEIQLRTVRRSPPRCPGHCPGGAASGHSAAPLAGHCRWTEAPQTLIAASSYPCPHEPGSVLPAMSIKARVRVERVCDTWCPVLSAASTS